MTKKKGTDKPSPPAGDTKFFNQLEPLRAFLHMKAPRKDKKDKRQLTLTFRMPLNGNIVRSTPESIQTAYAGVLDHNEDYVGIKQVIEGVGIEIFETEKNKKASEELTGVTIEKLAVKEIKSSKGDPSIVLTFEVVYPYDTSIWRFMGSHYGGDVALRFDSSQALLLDLADVEPEDEEEGDEQGELIPASESDGKSAAAGSE